jgi:non-heme chloroperoxidase
MTELDLRDAALVGFSMGTGECARYLGTFGSELVSKVAFLASIPPFVLKTAGNPDGVDGSVFDGIWASIAGDRHAFAACVPAWLTDWRDDLPKIDVPALVLHGDSYRILSIAATGDRLHESLEGNQYMVVEGGPHGLLWAHAEEVNRALLDFLG